MRKIHQWIQLTMKRPDLKALMLASANSAVRLRSDMQVSVKRDDGSTMQTKTRSEPRQLGHGQWVILVEGISGGYDCARVTPV